MLRCRPAGADNCRLDFSVSPTVSSLSDPASWPSHKGPSQQLTIEWEL
jgi:hypothetical protein